jgi:SAM-dependent methyltransferase
VCTYTCIDFARNNLTTDIVEGKRVVEIGSRDVNGSVRPVVEDLQPAEYTGVDIEPGPRVDIVCDATGVLELFGPESFDIVISTELHEHVRDWRTVINNMKSLLRPGGTLLITTRSKGFWLHGWPWDFWRYEPEDMKLIFADMDIKVVEPDPFQPGVFLLATKVPGPPAALASIALFSIVTGKRQLDVTDREVALSKVRHRASRAYWGTRAAAATVRRAIHHRST